MGFSHTHTHTRTHARTHAHTHTHTHTNTHTECISQQLSSMKKGLNSLLPQSQLSDFSSYELEVILCGQLAVDVNFIRDKTSYIGYTAQSIMVKWLWEVLQSMSQVFSMGILFNIGLPFPVFITIQSVLCQVVSCCVLSSIPIGGTMQVPFVQYRVCVSTQC